MKDGWTIFTIVLVATFPTSCNEQVRLCFIENALHITMDNSIICEFVGWTKP